MTQPPPLVLVAEDEPLASMALRAQLEALDYRVLGPARDGNEAVALGACFPVELALFDFRMPGPNGVEAAQALFHLAPTPVVLLSGFDNAYLPAPLPRPPIFASLTKPADMAELRGAIASAMKTFQEWLDAGPSRPERVEELRRERATIEDALRTTATDGSLLRDAVDLFDRAGREGRPLLDLARDLGTGQD